MPDRRPRSRLDGASLRTMLDRRYRRPERPESTLVEQPNFGWLKEARFRPEKSQSGHHQTKTACYLSDHQVHFVLRLLVTPIAQLHDVTHCFQVANDRPFSLGSQSIFPDRKHTLNYMCPAFTR